MSDITALAERTGIHAWQAPGDIADAAIDWIKSLGSPTRDELSPDLIRAIRVRARGYADQLGIDVSNCKSVGDALRLIQAECRRRVATLDNFPYHARAKTEAPMNDEAGALR